MKKNLLTVEEAAKLLSLKISRVRHEIFKKRIEYLKIGRSIRFEEETLIKWLESKKVEARSE